MARIIASSSLVLAGRVADSRLIGGDGSEFRETGKALNRRPAGPIVQGKEERRSG
ncbi:hypothetical protein [Nocardioides pocheonensis]|uniref:hypothetical protein n=1 Tax=Nocardioides pocheonensis TaxID=661485 RepID=UPI00160D8E38|nr:hypothetical protein [Nocardioides pocheonensis]